MSLDRHRQELLELARHTKSPADRLVRTQNGLAKIQVWPDNRMAVWTHVDERGQAVGEPETHDAPKASLRERLRPPAPLEVAVGLVALAELIHWVV